MSEWKVVLTMCALATMMSAAIAQPQIHADYVVVGKSVNHRQSASGSLNLLNTVFFAEVFETANGTVRNARLYGPGEAAKGLEFGGDDIHFLAGTRQYSIEDLTENFPDTTYYFSFDTPEGNVRELPATFKRDEGETRNPGPIQVSLVQNGHGADPATIDPDRDLTIRWTPFIKGSSDPNDIIDDMIYVIVGDCMGNEIAHSGHAISNPNALTYRATEFVVPAQILDPGQPFQLEIEHSNMDTDSQNDIEIIVTYAATTFLDIRTVGDDVQNSKCPAPPYAMDGGQTDRQRKP